MSPSPRRSRTPPSAHFCCRTSFSTMAGRGGALTSKPSSRECLLSSSFRQYPPCTYDGPALFLAGGRSDYVQPAYEPAIRRFFPRHEIARIEKAGHWLHAEQPAEFLAIIERFLSR